RARDRVERKRQELIERQSKRVRWAEERAAKGGIPKIVLGKMKRASQETSGRIDRRTKDALDEAVQEAWLAFEKIKVDPVMYAKLPEVRLPKGKLVLEAQGFNFRFEGANEYLFSQDLNFHFEGPARIALRGPNGSGKSTLIQW